MVNTSPLFINNLPYGSVSAPAAGKPHAKCKDAPNAENARELLKLVTVGQEVLDASSLNQEPSFLIHLAQEIKNSIKKGTASLEHGRIHISKEHFDGIAAGYKTKANNAGVMIHPTHQMPEIEKLHA